MHIERSGLKAFKGVSAAYTIECPECRFENTTEQCDYLYDFKNQKEYIEVTCHQCGCIYRLERRKDDPT